MRDTNAEWNTVLRMGLQRAWNRLPGACRARLHGSVHRSRDYSRRSG